jgi:hypothetical protein
VANVRSRVDAAMAVTADPCGSNSEARTIARSPSATTGARNQALTAPSRVPAMNVLFPIMYSRAVTGAALTDETSVSVADSPSSQ